MAGEKTMRELDCGVIVNTHGVRGEVKIKCECDVSLLAGLTSVYIGGIKCEIEQCREHKGMALVKLAGVDTIEQAMALKNRRVTADKDDIALPEGHYFYDEIYGFEVYDRRVGRVVGTLRQMREAPAGMLYIIEGERREFLVPAVDAFKRGVDFDARRVEIETIWGMLPDED